MCMDIKNCVPYSGPDKKHKYYLIIDSKDNLAEECFDRKQIKVEYKNEWGRKSSKYIIRQCRVRSEDDDDFHAALRELMVVMHVKGYNDYRNACNLISESAVMLLSGSSAEIS